MSGFVGTVVLSALMGLTANLGGQVRSGLPSVGSVVLSPLGLLVFEPAHLVMERRMLLGIKERAERNQEKNVVGGGVNFRRVGIAATSAFSLSIG